MLEVEKFLVGFQKKKALFLKKEAKTFIRYE